MNEMAPHESQLRRLVCDAFARVLVGATLTPGLCGEARDALAPAEAPALDAARLRFFSVPLDYARDAAQASATHAAMREAGLAPDEIATLGAHLRLMLAQAPQPAPDMPADARACVNMSWIAESERAKVVRAAPDLWIARTPMPWRKSAALQYNYYEAFASMCAGVALEGEPESVCVARYDASLADGVLTLALAK